MCCLSVECISPSKLVGYVGGYNFTVGSAPAKLVYTHHSDTHPAPRLVLADHYTYGQRDGFHLSKGAPICEDATSLGLFHGHENPTNRGREEERECVKKNQMTGSTLLPSGGHILTRAVLSYKDVKRKKTLVE